MPKLIFLEVRPNCKAAAVRYFISQDEDIHLCYSLGREHGPGIIRDGKGPPWMPLLDSPWETTTDPILQRRGTWFIKEKEKRSFIDNKAKPHLDQLSLPQQYKDKIISEFENTNVYRSFCEKSKFRNKIIGLQSFGDLTMNLWNVAFIDPSRPYPSQDVPKLLFLGEERINDRIYTCLVKWKENAPDAPTREGRKLRISIEDLRFQRYAYDINPSDPQVVTQVKSRKGIADQIEFAASGQLLIREGALIESSEIVHQFSDIRHLLSLPNLNPEVPLFELRNTNFEPLDRGQPRYYFGYEQKDAIWFAEAQLLEDRNLRRAALKGPVELSRLYEGFGASKRQVTAALNWRVPQTKEKPESFYKEGPSPPKPLNEGQWRFVIDDDSLVEVWLKPNIFPCSILSVTDEGDIICFTWRGNYNIRPGYTIPEAANTLLAYGGKEAILLDEGGDVRHEFYDPEVKNWREIVVAPDCREQVRSIFIFTKKKK